MRTNKVIIKQVSDSIAGCLSCEFFKTWEKCTKPEDWSERRGYCKEKKRDLGGLDQIIKREPSEHGGKVHRDWIQIPDWCPLLDAATFDDFRKQMQLSEFKFTD